MKISEERIKWVLRDYEGVLKYCDARYANYRRSYICEKQELQNFVLPKIDFEPRSSSGGDKRDLSLDGTPEEVSKGTDQSDV